ncbi:MAG: high frequency lysogenization protein HflD [Methylococcaceae bacterium]|nr:high frequency lysogenization protein HflD [Methylococcaceae bacterium]
MSLNTFTNQTIALAGISQSAALVQQLATTGKADAEMMEASIGSLLKINSDSVEDVFGGLKGLKFGLEQFQLQITGYNIENRDQARYAASLVFLERKLSKQPEMLETIYKGIQRSQQQTEHFELMHENVLANLGDVYFNTISTIEPRIMVNGDEQYLQRTEVVNKIRSLLLAGVRSAMLWRQCGGARWKFLFYRKKLQEEAKFLLTKV